MVTTATPTKVKGSGKSASAQQKIQELRDLYADAPELRGIRSPQAKDYLAKHQVTAEGWYVANDLTVAETRRLERVGKAVDELLDKIG